MAASKSVALFASLLLSTASAKKGTEALCIGPKPHIVTYDIDGETLDKVENASISVEPDMTSDLDCGLPLHSGNKTLCVGANVDPTCTHASEDVKINSFLDCPNCFAAVSMDLFYNLTIKSFRLEEVAIGLHQTNLRAAGEINAHVKKSIEPLHGKITLLSDRQLFKISFWVAHIVPVTIRVALPTTLNYDLTLAGNLTKATVGAALDLNLGNHFVRYKRGSGFSFVNDKPALTIKPKFGVDVGAAADFSVGLESSLAVNIDKVISYNLNLAPEVPMKLDLEKSDKQICASIGEDFLITHEAKVYFTLLGIRFFKIFQYGPKELYHQHKDNLFYKCLNISRSNSALVV